MTAFAAPDLGALPSSAAPVRPREVFAAAYLLVGAAAFWIAATVATMFAMPQYERHYTELAQSPDGGVLAVLGLSLTVFFAVLAAALFILLGALDASGRPAARVLTWIFGGLAVCVAGLILSVGVFTGIAWHQWLMNSVAIVTAVFILAAIVLLALPPSGEYFLRTRQARQARAQLAHAARYGFAPWTAPGSFSSGVSGPMPTSVPEPAGRTVFGLQRKGWVGIAAGIVLLAVMIVATYPK